MSILYTINNNLSILLYKIALFNLLVYFLAFMCYIDSMFGKDIKIEDLVLERLGEGPQEISDLIVFLREKRSGTTKQAVYKALRGLRAHELIVQTRGEVALSSLWLKKLSDFVQQAQLNYRINDQPSVDFLSLKNGEKITYWFKTFEATDMFWAHAFDILSDIMPLAEAIYLYNPHEWFLLARPESEIFLFNRLKSSGRKLLVMAGNRDTLDIEAGKYFDGETLRYFASPDKIFPKQNYYVNVFNDYLIEVWLDVKVSVSIDQFYKTTKILDNLAKEKLLEIIKQKGRNKLVIYRNERKASKIKNIFKKIF